VHLHDSAAAARLAGYCVDHGILGRQLNDGALHISPPFIITEEEIGQMAEVIAAGLDAEAAS
jgi:adenosylmethionine-8-amino-7-oxononanoate aminotransferase